MAAETIVLRAEQYARIIEHAWAGLPGEVVGLLGGTAGCVRIVMPLPNVMASRAFLADPFAQFHAERELLRSNLQLIGIYHSHPGGGAQLSPCDLVFARTRSCVHIVVALDRPHQAGEEVRAFRIVQGCITEVSIRILRDRP